MKPNKVNQLKVGAIYIYSYGDRFYSQFSIYTYNDSLIRTKEYGLYNLAASIIAYLGILNFGFVAPI